MSRKHRLLFVALLGVGIAAVATAHRQYRIWQQQRPGIVDLETAWKNVRDAPRSGQAWANLGDAQAAMDQPEAAEHSYQTAIRLGEETPSLPGRLGFLLYSQGRDREAHGLLTRAKHGGADLPMLDFTLRDLEERLSAQIREQADEQKRVEAEAPAATPQPIEQIAPVAASCTIPVFRTHKLGTFLVELHVNQVATTLVVDTGASLTALDAELLSSLGVFIDEERAINAITAAGPAVLPTATVDSLTVGGANVDNLRVAVCAGCGGKDARGLLGLDVQAALGLDLDLQGEVLRFVDCP